MNAELTLIGHASMKIKTKEGVVIYIDPYYEGDYSEPADIILSTHDHYDHSDIGKVTQKPDCRVLRIADTMNPDLTYNNFDIKGVQIEPVPAGGNQNHHRDNTVGYLLHFDGLTVYHPGDTSYIPEMEELKNREIDYAFFPIDGVYNMDPEEATYCANLIGAKHNIPMHFFEADPMKFTAENLLRMNYGETIELEK